MYNYLTADGRFNLYLEALGKGFKGGIHKVKPWDQVLEKKSIVDLKAFSVPILSKPKLRNCISCDFNSENLDFI